MLNVKMFMDYVTVTFLHISDSITRESLKVINPPKPRPQNIIFLFIAYQKKKKGQNSQYLSRRVL